MLNPLQCINKGQSKLQELQVHEPIKNKTQLWEVINSDQNKVMIRNVPYFHLWIPFWLQISPWLHVICFLWI